MPSTSAPNFAQGNPDEMRRTSFRGQPHFFSFVPLGFVQNHNNNPLGTVLGRNALMIKFIRRIAADDNGCVIIVHSDPTTHFRRYSTCPSLQQMVGPSRVEVLKPASGGQAAQNHIRRVIALVHALLIDKDLFWDRASTFGGFQDAFDVYKEDMRAAGHPDLSAHYPFTPIWMPEDEGH